MRKFFSDIWNDEGVFIDFATSCLNVAQVLLVANPAVSAAIIAATGALAVSRRRKVTPKARRIAPPKRK